MRIAILGPLVVEDGPRHGRSPGPAAGAAGPAGDRRGPRGVPGALADAVWEGDPPRDEQHALQSLVSRLRRALGDAGADRAGGGRLPARGRARRRRRLRFERLAREGGAALRAGDAAGAAALADARWRSGAGPALADAPRLAELPAAAARIDRLDGRRAAQGDGRRARSPS